MQLFSWDKKICLITFSFNMNSFFVGVVLGLFIYFVLFLDCFLFRFFFFFNLQKEYSHGTKTFMSDSGIPTPKKTLLKEVKLALK